MTRTLGNRGPFALDAVAWLRCHVDIATCDSGKHAWMMRVKYIPDIAIKIIGIILSATIWQPAMIYAVLVTMMWMLIPIDGLYKGNSK